MNHCLLITIAACLCVLSQGCLAPCIQCISIDPSTNTTSINNTSTNNTRYIDYCTKCFGKFVLSNGNCMCSVQNCLQCDSNGDCAQCNQGYSLNQNTCFFCPSPCATCSSDGVCLTCITPTYSAAILSPGQPCFICDDSSCRTCLFANSSFCVECISVYKSVQGRCVVSCNYPNCVACNPGSGLCSQCSTGFALITTSSPSICSRCQGTSNCLLCDSDIKNCSKCADGFFKQQTVCSACPSFCLTCSNATTCLILRGGLSTITQNNITRVAACDSDCAVCSLADAKGCTQCKDGYYIFSTGKSQICKSCSAKSKCRLCVQNQPTICTACYANCYLSSTLFTCTCCDPTCVTCSPTDPTICTSCAKGNFVDANKKCTGKCSQSCQVCVSSSACQVCARGFYVFQGVCQPCLASCSDCLASSPNLCLDCGTGSYLNVTNPTNPCTLCSLSCKNCTQIGCILCQSGYHLYGQGQCAVDCVQPCATCSPQNAQFCLTCLYGYSLTSVNTCLPTNGTTLCAFGYYLSNNQCLPCAIEGNCERCEVSPTICSSCFKGRYLNQSSSYCIPCSLGCSECTNSQVCNLCAAGYFSETGDKNTNSIAGCRICTPPCLTCTVTNRTCLSCLPQYKLVGRKCVSNHHYSFRIVFLVDLPTFLKIYVRLLRAIRKGLVNSSPDSIYLSSITSGSTTVLGTISTQQPAGSLGEAQEFASIGAIVNAASFQDAPISSSSLAIQLEQQSTSSDSSSLLLPILIPLLFAAILTSVVVLICIKRKKMQALNSESKFVDPEDDLSAKYII